MGTPAFAVPPLTALLGQGHDLVAVYTRAPAPGGRRGLDLVESPVHRCANAFHVPVFTPKSLKNPDVQAQFAAHEADVAVVVAYGLLLPKPVLDAPALGCFNLHASLLPRWRGAAPIQRAIMAGDTQTGIMVMRMEEGLDTGPIAMSESTPIEPNITASLLHDRLSALGADLMVRALAALARSSLTLTPQSAQGVVYAAKIDKSETRIDFSAPAVQVHNHIRALAPAPGAWCEIAGRRIKVLAAEPVELSAAQTPHALPYPAGAWLEGTWLEGAWLGPDLTFACSQGAIRLLQVQPAGKSPMSATEFLAGARLEPGCRAQ